MNKIICFGEVLWDFFPAHQEIGITPLFINLKLHSFKNNVAIIRSVENDTNSTRLKNTSHIKV
jgi:fructokinase